MSTVAAAAEALAAGHVVAFPTETVWGLACRLDRPAGLERLTALKRGRDASKPFQVMAGSVSDVARIVADTGALVAVTALGPVTAVVQARARLPAEVTADGTVGVRLPTHPVAAAIAVRAGLLAATSANPSGRPPVTCVAEARRTFGADVACYVDGDPPPDGAASTVVDLTHGSPRVLREGAVALCDIEKALVDCRDPRDV